MEDIAKGERTRKFRLEVKTDKGWQTLFQGSCIGHKFIQAFEDIEVSRVCLCIKEAIGEPTIKNFEIFRIEDYANAKKL
ncbi:hypothetical protein [Maribacter antarcticus]|uniref:hypothetical protein n=1 Tax=Maribacter antarcticus TaxID=505250 RepID=UPI000A84EF3D|nr:hypothetical protein [Maribacter antarcticus]